MTDLEHILGLDVRWRRHLVWMLLQDLAVRGDEYAPDLSRLLTSLS